MDDIRNSTSEESQFKEEVAKEKLIAAEGHISIIRLIIVFVNSLVYVLFVKPENAISWLAYPIIGLSIIYSFYYVFYRPYLKHPLLLTSYFTTLTDGAIIVGWIVATGISESPFYLLWCLSIVAVSQRYTFSETMLISVIFAATDLVLINIDIDAPVSRAELAVRILYIPITGLLGAYFSGEISGQIRDKLITRESETKAREAEQKTRNLLKDLNEQIEEKIKAENELLKMQKTLEDKVKERTTDLEEVNKELKKEITEKEKIQGEQTKTLEKLEEINKELESFAYVTSHDLKAPLRGIATLSDWLHKDYADKLDDQAKETLDLIKQRVQRMNELIEGILQYSKAGKTKETPRKIDTQELINEVISLLNPPENITIDVAGNLPLIMANQTQILQVFENLVSNAIKYMDKEKGYVEIGYNHEKGGGYFFVKDNGVGIPKKHHEKIFDMFQTLASQESVDSTGIGLAVTRKIINNMGGKIWVESELGKGSTFFFILPPSTIEIQSHGKTA